MHQKLNFKHVDPEPKQPEINGGQASNTKFPQWNAHYHSETTIKDPSWI